MVKLYIGRGKSGLGGYGSEGLILCLWCLRVLFWVYYN